MYFYSELFRIGKTFRNAIRLIVEVGTMKKLNAVTFIIVFKTSF